ncbi:unnamed protein product [Prorocentrum cordatum]|uniref:Methyltransferase domain-containing protein n=1 Tax=Prorocentrum cordatum TaxID=2364126 RepID=A0ABN9Q8J5_9DINO|nr:unnamed protein product [Polarella glacialis]
MRAAARARPPRRAAGAAGRLCAGLLAAPAQGAFAAGCFDQTWTMELCCGFGFGDRGNERCWLPPNFTFETCCVQSVVAVSDVRRYMDGFMDWHSDLFPPVRECRSSPSRESSAPERRDDGYWGPLHADLGYDPRIIVDVGGGTGTNLLRVAAA